jgi:hypothetical protein
MAYSYKPGQTPPIDTPLILPYTVHIIFINHDALSRHQISGRAREEPRHDKSPGTGRGRANEYRLDIVHLAICK